jgi:hypothetical protein
MVNRPRKHHPGRCISCGDEKCALIRDEWSDSPRYCDECYTLAKERPQPAEGRDLGIDPRPKSILVDRFTGEPIEGLNFNVRGYHR